MTFRHRIACSVVLGVAITGTRVAAQQNTGGIKILLPHAGDCSIVIDGVPVGDLGQLVVRINTRPIKLDSPQVSPVVVFLKKPLIKGENVQASTPKSNADVDVGDALTDAMRARTTCGDDRVIKRVIDERRALEANGYVGQVFDQFAPAEVGNYAQTPDGGTIQSRWTAGSNIAYRFIGSPSSRQQLWGSLYTLHGLRTADVDCTKQPDVPVCRNNATVDQKFLQVIEHASTIEIHTEVRYEFMTLQPDSDTPVRLFGAFRFGFIDLEGVPKCRESDTITLGFLVPSGTFRGSSAQFGLARSDLFQPGQHGFNRFKGVGTLTFDLIPSLASRAQIWKRIPGSMRFFLAVSVDRSRKDDMPDAVQSYVGILFDFTQAFRGIGQ
jgi:hypothetical protein